MHAGNRPTDSADEAIFFAEPGEEADPAGVGINFMVTQHFDEIGNLFHARAGSCRRPD
jgi:hypothetical protein